MKSICAWCFPNASQGGETEEITHGICPFHMEQMRTETIGYWRKEATKDVERTNPGAIGQDSQAL
jgi:ribosome modulation factor